METRKLENLFGALALAVADDVQRVAQERVTASAPAAAIALIGHVPELTIDQLARALGLSHPGAVRLVDRMVLDGLVLRGKSAVDGRAVALTLTEPGQTLNRELLDARQGAVERVLTVLTDDERSRFAELTEKMLRGLVRDERHALQVCRLCDVTVCPECPVEAEVTGAAGVLPSAMKKKS